jgi:peroxiredoxin
VLVVLIAVITGVAIVIVNWSKDPVWVAGGHASVGATAPDFTSRDLDGKKVGLTDFRGRPVLLTFWATWCTVCRDELPALQVLEDRYRSDGLAILAVNYRQTDNQSLHKYLAGLNVRLETVIDPYGTLGAAYGVRIGLPVNVLTDRSGKVARIMIGEVPIASIESSIEQVIPTGAAP